MLAILCAVRRTAVRTFLPYHRRATLPLPLRCKMSDQAGKSTLDAATTTTASVADKVAKQAGAGGEPGQYLDEPTGEMVSKGELKRRQKQREKEKRKADKVRRSPVT